MGEVEWFLHGELVAMKVGVLKETARGERRVALAPANVPHLQKAGLEVTVEPGAGLAAGFTDAAYAARGAHVAASREEAADAELLLPVRALRANAVTGQAEAA